MSFKKSAKIAALILPVALVLLTGNIACSKKAETPAAGEKVAVSQEMGIKEGLNDVHGTVKRAFGRYFYIAQLPGFDIGVPGEFDAASLIDKEVQVKAEFNRQTPSLLVAQSIEVKEGEGQLKNVYTGTEKGVPADFFAPTLRPEYVPLTVTNVAKSADWEGKAKVRVFGRFNSGAAGKPSYISILGDKGQETARILVDSMSGFAEYYEKKLRLFDKFWFYLTVKESVPAKDRAKTKEIFHADVVYAGLY